MHSVSQANDILIYTTALVQYLQLSQGGTSRKIDCDFPYPIYTLFKTCLIISSLVHRNVKDNDYTTLYAFIRYNSRLECKNHILSETRLAKIHTLFLTKNG